ncbi:hypothetical protein [Marinobacter sp.]|uniref:hypothetical protein n=1 Tax=Marinobacter sp. TaxID=50741 RepID=UPI003B52A553
MALAIRHHGGDQPALWIEQNPARPGMMANCLQQHLMVDIVEEPLNIEVDDPVILLAALPGLCQCLMRGLVWPVPIGARVEVFLQPRLQGLLDHHLGDTIRHSGKIPRGRALPSLFGISTRLTGGGR